MLGETGTWFGTFFVGLCGIRTRGVFTPFGTTSFTKTRSLSSRPKIESIADSITNKPIIGAFGMIIRDWIPLINEYYYCGCCLIFISVVLLTISQTQRFETLPETCILLPQIARR